MQDGFRKIKLKYIIKVRRRTVVVGKIQIGDIEVLDSNVDSQYIVNYINSDYFTEILKSKQVHRVFNHIIVWSELLNSVVLLPSLKIQQNIVKVQNKFSDLLNEHITDIKELSSKTSSDIYQYPDHIGTIFRSILDFKKLVKSNDEVFRMKEKILGGESERVEFKETFNIDVRTGKKEKYIQESSLKNIVAFLNTEGGELFIGINDFAEIVGIERDDYKNDDSYLLKFKNQIKETIGEEYYPLISWKIVSMNDKRIMVVVVTKSEQPVFLNGKDFYVRTNPSADKLEGKKQYEYIKKRFK
jgi:hypothetical protein